MIKIYGLKNCSTCKKAFSDIAETGARVEMIDLRATKIGADALKEFLDIFGEERLINKRSQTWRTVPEGERTDDPIALMMRYPALMKRPLILSDKQRTLGWDEKTRALWL